MTVKQILTPIIEQEFRKYESNGYKVKLKTPRKGIEGSYAHKPKNFFCTSLASFF